MPSQGEMAGCQSFVHAFAHDLRQHLRAISVATQRIQRQAGAGLDPAIAERLDEVLAATIRQDQLISSAVDYGEASEVPTGSLMPLPLVLQTACLRIEEFRKEREGTIQLESSAIPAVKIPAALAKAFEKIMHNGMKFSPVGTAPVISIAAASEEPGSVRITFADQGLGIDEAYRERVFEPFQKLLPSEYPGSGMGLSIAQRMIAAVGGTIAIAANPASASGVVVTVDVPCQ
ncbi:hypothetical protein F183_A18700 [Bryobacterales bacterium F-183]|nr:hypothetical protein F183_A18700 [Bryobacterales bacterium F-183]